MKIKTVLFEELEPDDAPGFAVRVYAIGSDFEQRALPLFARVGEQRVREITISPSGTSFSGLLAQPPGPEDRLFARYGDEPEVEAGEEALEPPPLA